MTVVGKLFKIFQMLLPEAKELRKQSQNFIMDVEFLLAVGLFTCKCRAEPAQALGGVRKS
jgi:hypothetical protein